jgi:hypothetical protein
LFPKICERRSGGCKSRGCKIRYSKFMTLMPVRIDQRLWL